MPTSRSREDDDDVVDNYYDLDDKDSRTVGIKELDLNTLYPQHPLDYKNGSKYCIIGKPGCHKKGTKIMLYNGETKNVEDIQLGDVLMGDDSTPRNVLDLARGREEMYDIIPTNGEKYTVNKNHILCLKDISKTENITEISVIDLLNKSEEWRQNFRGYKVSVEFPKKACDEKMVYTIGLSLGHEDIKCVRLSNDKWLNLYKFTQDPITCSKFIPSEYKYNTREIRLQLLAGLVDSPAVTYDKNLYTVTIKNTIYHGPENTNQILLDDIIFLSRSLGFNCIKQNSTQCVIGGDLHLIPCKDIKNVDVSVYEDVLMYNLSINYVGIDNYYGFELDGNNRYLLGDFTVTHNTGKSTIIKSLLYAKKHIFSVGAFWSGTEDSNGFFRSFAPTTFIRDGMIDAASASSLKPLEDLNKRQKIARKYLEPRGDNPWCVEVLDDCTADPKFLKKTVLKDTYKNGRHKAKMHLLSLQFCLDIPTDTRGLIDGTFICREGNPKNRVRLFENFGSGVDNIHDWNDLMDGLTDDYCCMFVNNKSTSNNIEDCIQYYKADPNKIPKDWKFGCREYWDFHYDRYNPNFVEAF